MQFSEGDLRRVSSGMRHQKATRAVGQIALLALRGTGAIFNQAVTRCSHILRRFVDRRHDYTGSSLMDAHLLPRIDQRGDWLGGGSRRPISPKLLRWRLQPLHKDAPGR